MGINPLPGTKKIVADVRVGPKRQGFKRPRRRKVFPNTEAGREAATLWVAAMMGKRIDAVDDEPMRTFDGAYQFYVKRSKFTSLNPVTQKKYRYRLGKFLEFAAARGKLFLYEFSENDAEDYANCVMQNFAGRGIENRLMLASDLFEVELNRQSPTIKRNPFKETKKTGYETEDEIPYLEEDIVYEIFRNAKRREFLILLILYSTAMRVQELEKLPKANVTPTLTIIEKQAKPSGTKWKPKGNKEASIPHEQVTWEAYQELYTLNPPGKWVLLGDRPAGKGYLDKMCSRMRERFATSAPHIPYFTPHSFRRSLATHLGEKGERAEIVQKILRHTDIKTTLRYYMKITPASVRQGIAQIQGPLAEISRQLKSKCP